MTASDEQREREMRSISSLLMRICSAGLSLSLFLTGCGPLSITPVTVPNIGWPEAAGQERGNADVTVTGFGSLTDEVREQTVPLGTELSELALLDTLEAYVAADTGAKCGLCHMCPTFLGICCFIWLAVIIAVILIVAIVVLRRRKEEEEGFNLFE